MTGPDRDRATLRGQVRLLRRAGLLDAATTAQTTLDQLEADEQARQARLAAEYADHVRRKAEAARPAPVPSKFTGSTRRGTVSLVGSGLLDGFGGELTQETVSAALTLAEAHFGRARVHDFVRSYLSQARVTA